MKVFLVYRELGYDGDEHVAVCATRKLADAMVEVGGYEVEEYDIIADPAELERITIYTRLGNRGGNGLWRLSQSESTFWKWEVEFRSEEPAYVDASPRGRPASAHHVLGVCTVRVAGTDPDAVNRLFLEETSAVEAALTGGDPAQLVSVALEGWVEQTTALPIEVTDLPAERRF